MLLTASEVEYLLKELTKLNCPKPILDQLRALAPVGDSYVKQVAYLKADVERRTEAFNMLMTISVRLMHQSELDGVDHTGTRQVLQRARDLCPRLL